MNDAETTIYEIRRWAIEKLQQPRVGNEGTATLNREIISRLESCQVPEELIAVIARQLKVDGKVRNEPRLKREQMAAALALARDPELSDKKLARLCGVSRPTIALWKRQSQFGRLKAIFELDSVLREVFPCQQPQK